MTKQELDNKVAQIKEYMGNMDGNLMEIKKFFNKTFNKDIVKVGVKATFDLNNLFFMSKKWRKVFNNDPIQPITITYLRCDLIFFTYDKHPEIGEQYIDFESDWTKWLYLSEVKMTELWKLKEYLFHQDPDEYYIQLNSIDFKNPLIKYIKDIDFSNYYNDNESF